MSNLVARNQITYISSKLNDLRKEKNAINWKVVTMQLQTDEMYELLKEFINVNDYIANFAVTDEFLETNIALLDWKIVSQYCTDLSEAFIRTHKHQLDWTIFLKYKTDLAVDFLEEMYEYYDNDILMRYQTLTEAFLISHWSEINKDIVSRYQTLSAQFVIDYSSDLNFEELLVSGNLNETLLTVNFPTKLPFNQSIRYVQFSEETLTNANYYINWRFVSRYQTSLSTEFLELYKTVLDWNILSEHRRFSEAEMDQFSTYLDWIMLSKVNTANMTESYIVTNKAKLSGRMISKYKAGLTTGFITQNINFLDITYLLMYQTVDVTILETLVLTNIQWEILSKHQTLTEEFMTTYYAKLNKKYLAKFQVLSEEFITAHLDTLPSDFVCLFQTLSEGWITTNSAWVNWTAIAIGQTLSSGFKTTYAANLNQDLL